MRAELSQCIPVRACAGFRRTVRSLSRSSDFYGKALGFVRDGATWRLGGETIELQEADDAAPLSLPAPGHIDTRFQHIAIVTCDMAAALQRLSGCDFGAITQGRGAVTLPQSSGGVLAFKFRDPDGNPLELLQFPPGSGNVRWQRAATDATRDGTGPTLGIDHSAVVVADAERSIRFYEDRLGFTVASRQLNRGPEQDRLDGLAATQVDVIALQPGAAPTPHLELLGYRSPRAGTQRPVDNAAAGSDCIVWWVAALPEGQSELLLKDPDGHRHLLRAEPAH